MPLLLLSLLAGALLPAFAAPAWARAGSADERVLICSGGTLKWVSLAEWQGEPVSDDAPPHPMAEHCDQCPCWTQMLYSGEPGHGLDLPARQAFFVGLPGGYTPPARAPPRWPGLASRAPPAFLAFA
ncbi:hypothetical protein [Zobellella iuensis]|uniref:DUF2946 domain-containing protein n=1 Tax=Zobellella iuensis TaxID=2803811 RepID=A0ABS1QXD3_9GAMM|nr:hypothetical protein [Zobellella iuensis]MBL1379519.1 hypothetical protein [Zobellella iuensis]